MTWHISALRVRAIKLVALSVVPAALFACGDDDGGDAPLLRVTAPANGETLTRAMDEDDDAAGVQFNVVAEAVGLMEGDEIELLIADDRADISTVDADGMITFDNVTLAPGERTIVVRETEGDLVSEQDHKYTLRALVITTPDPGEFEDQDTEEEGFQLEVNVEAFAESGDITLEVDGDQVATQEQQDNEASFLIDLSPGRHTLQAVAGDIRSDEVAGTVPDDNEQPPGETCDHIDLVLPAVEGDSIMLGGEEACDDGKFTTHIVIATDAGDGLAATLMVNGNVADTVPVVGTLATFPDVNFDRRDTANRISVSVEDDEGTRCSQDFDIDFNVDCAGPDCTLRPPPTFQVTSGSDTTLYLNSGAGDDTEFDVGVETSEEAVGETVQLIVDGNTRSPLEVKAVEASGDFTAAFNNVDLGEGEHTVEARCMDSSGNATYSATATWTVDVTPCSIAIDEPASDFVFSYTDDDDSETDGTQVPVTVTLGGSDCTQAQAAVCDPDDGIPSDTTPMLLDMPFSVTLDDDLRDQDICVKVVDRAGNASTADVPVSFLSEVPQLAITSPSDGDQYNATGDDGSEPYEADEDDSTTACEATFTATCSEIGVDVDLVRAPGEGSETVLATAPCEDSDSAPEGLGLATFSEVAFRDGLGTSQTEAAFAVRQSADTSNTTLTGESGSITVAGDCDPPTLQEFSMSRVGTPQVQIDGRCPAMAFEPDMDIERRFRVNTVGVSEIVWTFTDLAGSTTMTPVTPQSTDSYRSEPLKFRTVGTATLDITLVDLFNNRTSVPTCTISVLDDPPVLGALAVGTPPATSTFTVATDNSLCTNAGTGQFQVPVVFSPDKEDATRELEYTVSGGSAEPVTLPLSGPVCVPVAEGASSISGILWTIDNGFRVASVQQSLGVTVSTAAISAPTNGADYVGSDCDTTLGGTLEAQLEVDVDEIYPDAEPVVIEVLQGESVVTTISDATIVSSQVQACVPLSDGTQTIRVTIPSTGATDEVSVTASDSSVEGAVVSNVQVNLPPADNPSRPSNMDTYRSTPVELTWDLPTGTYFFDEYELRCAAVEVTTTPAEWWNGATPMTDPTFEATAPQTTGAFDARMGERLYCMLRACETTGKMGQPARGCTDLPESAFEVLKPFRYQQVLPPPPPDANSPTHLGSNFTPVGDVNGDGINDLLAAGGNPFGAETASNRGTSEVYLYFGKDVAPSHATDPTAGAPDVIFREARPYASTAGFLGSSLAGLGDINGDGIADFAIGSPTHCEAAGCGDGTTRNHGALFIYFGRASGDDWESESANNVFDISTPCQADICLYGLEDNSDRAGVGRFDSDDLNDVALAGSRAGDNGRGLVYVLSGESFRDITCGVGVTSCSRDPSDAVFGVSKTLPTDDGDFIGYKVEGDFGAPTPGVYDYLGRYLVAVGDVSSPADGFDDLVVSSGRNFLGSVSALLTLSGREFGSGVQSLDATSLDEFYNGGTGETLWQVTALGNLWDDPGTATTAGRSDVGLGRTGTNNLVILPGDTAADGGFSSASPLAVNIEYGEAWRSACSGVWPALAVTDFDLDGDGLFEACAGSTGATTPEVTAGSVFLVYGSKLEGQDPGLLENIVAGLKIAVIDPPEVTSDLSTHQRRVEFVGDVTGDGHPDLVVGDRPITDDSVDEPGGGFWVLY